MKNHFLLLLVLLSAVVLRAQTPVTDNGNAANGKRLYMTIGCQACHGQTGQGVGGNRKLAPKPIPLNAGIAYVRKPAGQMIAYSPQDLSDAQLADIWAFLRAIPDNPAPSSVEILKSW